MENKGCFSKVCRYTFLFVFCDKNVLAFLTGNSGLLGKKGEGREPFLHLLFIIILSSE